MISDIILDEEARNRLEAPLNKIEGLLRKGECDEASVLKLIVEAEFSEWNNIFLYAMGSMSKKAVKFQQIASVVEWHKTNIEQFINSLGKYDLLKGRISELPHIWKHRLIIVDDNTEICRLLVSIFSKKLIVDTAQNGREGFEKIRANYYDVIVSDVEMPEVDGIEMYSRLAAADPDISRKFVFVTSESSHLSFFKDRDVPYLLKPFTIQGIMEQVDLILEAQVGLLDAVR
jgi:CheY-like chemotaxis protein